MKTVYKYTIPIEDQFELELPIAAQVFTVQTQNGHPHIWALVDPDAPKEPRLFRLAGTGHPMHNRNLTYIGSFQMKEGALVFHLFEWGRP